VPEGLLDYGQMDVARNEGKAERVLEAMRVPSVGWKSGALRDRLEGAKELRAVNPSALCDTKTKSLASLRSASHAFKTRFSDRRGWPG
jgi:hypothetical protein